MSKKKATKKDTGSIDFMGEPVDEKQYLEAIKQNKQLKKEKKELLKLEEERLEQERLAQENALVPVEQPDYVQPRTFPVNNLDSSWLSAEPNYTDLQNNFKIDSPRFARVFSIFNSGIRLSKLTDEEARRCEYDLITCADVLDLGLYDFALSVFFDVASVLETRQSKTGFRTDAMNKVTQEIKKMEMTESKKNLFGGNKKSE